VALYVEDDDGTYCTATKAFCIPKPTPMPARIWKPIIFALAVSVSREYNNPDPMARKIGAATRNGQLCDNVMSNEGKSHKERKKVGYALVSNPAHYLSGNNDGQNSTQHEGQ